MDTQNRTIYFTNSAASGIQHLTPKRLKLPNFQTHSSILGIHLVAVKQLKLLQFDSTQFDFGYRTRHAKRTESAPIQKHIVPLWEYISLHRNNSDSSTFRIRSVFCGVTHLIVICLHTVLDILTFSCTHPW